LGNNLAPQLEDMKVTHWTSNRDFKLRPIQIRNGYRGNGLREKPLGGLWCSPSESKWSWKDWCEAEDYGDINQCTSIIFEISEEGMLVINSEADLNQLPIVEKYGCMGYIDFEKLLQQGYKSLWLTEEGAWKTRHSYPVGLYPWDCETVLIMDESIIIHQTKEEE